jgi:hypothetical protein
VPLIFGFTLTDAFKNTADGYVRRAPNDPVAGGHFSKNSWGRAKGNCGFYYLDYAWVMSQLCFATVLAL